MRFLLLSLFFIPFVSSSQLWLSDSTLIVECLDRNGNPYENFSLKINGIEAQRCTKSPTTKDAAGYFFVKPWDTSAKPIYRYFFEAKANGYEAFADSVYPLHSWSLFRAKEDYVYRDGNRVPCTILPLRTAVSLGTMKIEELMKFARQTNGAFLGISNDCDDFFNHQIHADVYHFEHTTEIWRQNFLELIEGTTFVPISTNSDHAPEQYLANSGSFMYFYQHQQEVNDFLKLYKEMGIIEHSTFDMMGYPVCLFTVKEGSELKIAMIFDELEELHLGFSCTTNRYHSVCFD